MDRELLNPPGVHPPQAHYSHVARAGKTLYISGSWRSILPDRWSASGDARLRRGSATRTLGDPRPLRRELPTPAEDHHLHHPLGLSPAGGRRARRAVPRAALSANTLVVVQGLAEPHFLVEIEGIAVLD
jgi:hypothetical protein